MAGTPPRPSPLARGCGSSHATWGRWPKTPSLSSFASS